MTLAWHWVLSASRRLCHWPLSAGSSTRHSVPSLALSAPWRHTPDDMYSPTRQPAKRCREPAAFAAADRGGRARRVRGDRHGEATVIPYDAAGASARACGSVEGSTARRGGGAPTAPLPHHSRTTPAPLPLGGSGAAHTRVWNCALPFTGVSGNSLGNLLVLPKSVAGNFPGNLLVLPTVSSHFTEIHQTGSPR